VTDATIAVAGTEPGRLQRCGPAPLAIGAPKQVGGARRLTLLAESSDQLAPLKGWWPIAHPEWAGSAVTVRRIARMHVDATTAEDDGRLYSYEAIDADQLLLAQLTLPGSASGALGGADQAHALWAKWCHAQGEIRLGRSSKDDYGLVQIAAAALEPDPPQIGRRDGDRYTVAWLTSAFTGRDRVGRDAADGTLLGQALLDALPPGAKVRAAVARQARVESWQRSWGLPRPSLPTVAGGSCVLLGLDGPDDDTWRGHLAAAQQRGVGLRRAEGFGSVRFIACEDGGAH
jgi:CRISPR-associated protein Csx10